MTKNFISVILLALASLLNNFPPPFLRPVSDVDNLVVLPLLSYVCGIRDSMIGVVCSVMRIVGLALRGVVTTTRLFYGGT